MSVPVQPNALVFRSHVDWRLAAIVFVPAGLAVTGTSASLVRQPHTEAWIALAVSVLVLAFGLWVYATTAYEVGEAVLIVRSGPVCIRVPIATIRQISTSHAVIAAPALSLRRLKLEYGTYDVAIVSPADHGGFIAALVERNPAIVVRTA
jgi:hypothetical protein